ncbi:hypothetical protein K491DRAFT_695375 [Lophiostoma macrostomum CBS 122681]|uniref:Zn(2)-C6 fungal-type domain-containing protein n=1 Tax=Lophiostoma macrostomum CBS 122681 TaxID=1314788 RepID=A0A6A6T1A5_9PLEO|nr:hypothetical protein K491DRAFT_695375 [Lophiostoma macrostomum CBS 122681]
MDMHRETGGQGRPVRVVRRSCDQCRSRKVGCDRGTPCSPCVSARLSCTHSAVAQSSTGPRQRVLISTQYEQKIDAIARDIDGIKQSLQSLQLTTAEARPKTPPVMRTAQGNLITQPETVTGLSASSDEIAWGNSTHVTDFIGAVVREGATRAVDLETNQVLSSLQLLLQRLGSPLTSSEVGFAREAETRSHDNTTMPPQDAVVAVLKWAKEHTSNVRLAWLGQILPLERFTKMCQNIYFSVDGYSEIDYILANGFLSYVFFEHLVVSGRSDFAEYSQLCRNSLHSALSRLPLLIPSSVDVIAALTLGAYNAVENSKANAAWTFISAASTHCLTLGYNRLRSYFGKSQSVATAQEGLFWAVYRLDKGISLRLGQSSNLRDGDISLSLPNDARMRTANIQGRAYDELYSPKGLIREDFERTCIAESFALEVRQCIAETKADILKTFGNSATHPTDPVGKAYMQCDLICQYSLLTLILRAVSAPVGSPCTVSDECLSAAREALHMHEECIATVRSCKNEPLMLARYVNWAIVHCPFPPFFILLTHSTQLLDALEVCDLERFAASLESPDSPWVSGFPTQPAHLYHILCKAARLYLDFNTTPANNDLLGFQSGSFGNAGGTNMTAPTLEDPGQGEGWLGDWFYENQLIMGVLDQNMHF